MLPPAEFYLKCLLILMLVPIKTSSMRTMPVSTCTTTYSAWNYNLSSIPTQLQSWLQSLGYPRRGWSLQSGRYHQVTGHLVPHGLSWRWRGRDKIHGFLYGEVDKFGDFSGGNISFIYPDFLTALRGTFKKGVLHNAVAVDIVGERCNNGVKELMFEKPEEDSAVIWENTGNMLFQYGSNPKVTDPHEKKSVYVCQSTNPRAQDGLFARRKFYSGDLVSYYGGEKLFLTHTISPNMTTEQLYHSRMYTLALGKIDEEMLVDVRGKNRNIAEYRTTLGHKANHKFERQNVVYQSGVQHPALGDVAVLVAIADIEAGEEVFVNYNYNLQLAALWYREEHDYVYGKCYQDQHSEHVGSVHMGSNDFCF